MKLELIDCTSRFARYEIVCGEGPTIRTCQSLYDLGYEVVDYTAGLFVLKTISEENIFTQKLIFN